MLNKQAGANLQALCFQHCPLLTEPDYLLRIQFLLQFCLIFQSKTSPHYDSFTTLKFHFSESSQYFDPWLLLWPTHICSLSNLFDFVHGHPTLQASQPDELTIEEHEVLEVIEDGDMEDWVKVYSFAHITPSCDVLGIYFGSWSIPSKLCLQTCFFPLSFNPGSK